jgi:SAM-dependent methyltransferase
MTSMTTASQHEHRKYADIYAAGGRYAAYGHKNHGKNALALVQKWQPESLVDVGCGWNEFSRSVRESMPRIASAIGVDFACPGADVIADATALPFADKAFDALTSFDMLEHLLPAQVDAVLAEFARISRRFVFSISHVPSVITSLQGENLHPTVRGEPWWMLRIMRAGGCKLARQGHYITGEWAPPLRIAPGARVILVGNGPSALQGCGAEIDAFDEVVRFNEFQLEGFTEHVGTKTTLWSTFGRGVLPGGGTRPGRILCIHESTQAMPACEARELYRVPAWFYNETRRHVQQRAWWTGGFDKDPASLLPTSGLLVAAWLLQVVGVHKITLAGFDHFSKVNSRQHHYWVPKAYGKPKEHDGGVEAAMFAELRARGLLEYLPHPL